MDEFRNVEVRCRFGDQTMVVVVSKEELAAFGHTVTRVGWSIVGVEWTDKSTDTPTQMFLAKREGVTQ